MTAGIVRVAAHPNEPAAVLLLTSWSARDAMLAVPMAAWDAERRAYVMPRASLPTACATLLGHGLTVVDEDTPRRTPDREPVAATWQPCPRCLDLVVLLNANGRQVTAHECEPT